MDSHQHQTHQVVMPGSVVRGQLSHRLSDPYFDRMPIPDYRSLTTDP
jgi:hypothetical protein